MSSTSPPHIVYPDAGDDAREVLVGERLARLRAVGEFDVHYGRPETHEEYVRRIAGSAAILLGWDLPAEVMAAAPRLEIVSFTGIGVAKFVDLDLAAQRGITVCNCPGYSDNTVAEHALALLLAAARQVPALDASLRRGEWSPAMGMELKGKRLGLIGYGGIGRRFGDMAHALGMEVVVWTRNPTPERAGEGVTFVSLDELLGSSDAVSLHIAATKETACFLDRGRIAQLKPGAIVVNTARGEVVDEIALAQALAGGRLRAAGIDVFTEEPLPSDHVLCALDNVVLSPHVAYKTPEAELSLFDIAIDNIVRYFRQDPINVVAGPARKEGSSV